MIFFIPEWYCNGLLSTEAPTTSRYYRINIAKSTSHVIMSVNFLATSVPSEPDNFAGTYGIYPIHRTSVGVLISIQFKETAIHFQSDKSNYKLSVGSKKGEKIPLLFKNANRTNKMCHNISIHFSG